MVGAIGRGLFPKRLRDWLLKEFPAHRRRMKAFSIMRYPVTNAEFSSFCGTDGSTPPESIRLQFPAHHPVWGVSFDQAQRYSQWRGAREGLPLRLPSECEWERAAGGPAGRRYPFGDSFDVGCCNTVEAGHGRTTPVDAYDHAASDWGVVDMAGNVEEWTTGRYAPYPGGVVIDDDLLRLLGPGYRVLRGGSFLLGGDLARTRRRHGRHPGDLFRVSGFRLAMSEASDDPA